MDRPDTEHTTCDECGKRAFWKDTTRWSIVGDKCYCITCTGLRSTRAFTERPTEWLYIQPAASLWGDEENGSG